MIYESSYDSGRKPFVPDTERGYWAKPTDFLFACWGLAFRMDVFTISWLTFGSFAAVGLIPLLILMALIAVPIILIQSFLGQFSSSGFISVLRISPLFKGIGYFGLFINILIMSYFGIFVAIPLLLMFSSMRTVLPWSCEAIDSWGKNLTTYNQYHICNINDENNDTNFMDHKLPSMIFLRNHFAIRDMDLMEEDGSMQISLELVACMFLAWLIITLIFNRCYQTAKFGILLRYLLSTALTLLLICIVRFLLFPGVFTNFMHYIVNPTWPEVVSDMVTSPLMIICLLGPGFGAIISFASNNKFKTNIANYSWFICLGQVSICVAFGILTLLVEIIFEENESTKHVFIWHHWTLIVSSASAITYLSWPQFWSIIFFGMLTLTALTSVILQMHSIFTSVFDEFVYLRSHKSTVINGSICFWCMTSFYYCSNHGLVDFLLITVNSITMSSIALYTTLIVVLWFYGRERFQRDLQFMLGVPFATWRVNILRIVAILGFIVILTIVIFAPFFVGHYTSALGFIMEFFISLLPWLCIIGYAVVCILQTTGPFCMRLRRCCRPSDWYPMELEHRSKYEETLGNMEITQQLDEVATEAFS